MDATEYKFGAKNHWRRNVWNVIARHTPNPSDAIVLYLPGSKDLDRPEALRRGFKAANLIAVERSPEVAKHLRAQGVTVVQGTLNEVLASWPAGRPIAGVIADFQCGYTDEVDAFVELWNARTALREAFAVVNLMRGRDAKWAHAMSVARATYESALEHGDVLDLGRYLDLKAGRFGLTKNRGLLVAAAGMRKIGRAMACHSEVLQVMLAKTKLATVEMVSQKPEEARSTWAELKKEYDAKRWFRAGLIVPLPSYRSGTVTFDSVFLQARFITADKVPSEDGGPLARHVGAALAIRTRRLRGELRAGAA